LKQKPGTAPAVSALNDASCALVRALLKLTKTIEARIPIMAITMRSSMSVKTFLEIHTLVILAKIIPETYLSTFLY
jgi:hypothetical protein